MRFALLVVDGPLDCRAGRAALRFAQDARSAGDSLEMVFFHGEGVRAAASASVVADTTAAEWQVLARDGVPLLACATALERRGLAVGSGPVVSGSLGQLMAALDRVDRVVTFADRDG